MTQRRAAIRVHGIDLDCVYEYERAEEQTWDHPGSPENASLCECIHKGEDIFELLTEDTVEYIEGLLIERVGNERERQREDYYDSLREERLLERQA